MSPRTTVALTALVLIAAAGILLAHTVLAQGVPIEPGPCRPGWTCECNTTELELERAACVTGNGTPGTIFVTVCQQCPPPDCETPEGPCRIFPCEYSVTSTCQ